MAYIGKQPVIGNFQKCDAISVVNGQAAYTMQVGGANVSPESENHMLVSLNGILQAPVDSFTISGSTITFASNLATGDVIDFIMLLGNVLDLGTPSDNTVSLAKLTATGTKDATTFLRGDNTFAEAGGGAWNLISTTTISSDATVSITGMDSTYKNYVMILNNLHPATNNVRLQSRAIISGSPYTTGNYFSIIEHSRTGNASNEFDNNEGQTAWDLTHDGNGMGNANSDSMNMIINIYNPSDTTFEKHIQTQATYNHNIVNNMTSRSYSLNAIHSITSAFTGLQFFFSSGNMDTGTIKLYGLS